MTSAFDPDAFIQTVVTEPNDTVIEPVPIGEYHAIIKDFTIHKDRQTKAGEPIYPMDVIWSIQNPEIKERLGRNEVTSRQSIFLDITANGALDMGKGKNVGLGRLREAIGMNSGPFSFASLKGAGPAKVSIKHDPDKNDPKIIRDRVASVGKL